MLTAVELTGFKSFADRTRLEFSDGISALVGPNGSGKSNIVDAIKWVLGEQSHKKLRANEATDVIFNGSSGRDPLGAAEVTLTFDNTTRIFSSLDTREVHITRRIYRSGEGEYLVNRLASRLRDIKELLAGTGLGTQAYSIIEQGRVESLLQSSPVQRRGIFEDAAGISRFHTKKAEAGRRLERVEHNLTRVGDIVGEVEQQFKTAKAQAGRAQQYRDYTTRLQELRTEAALGDWRRLYKSITSAQSAWDKAAARQRELAANVERLETDVQACSSDLEQIDEAIRTTEKKLATATERTASEFAAVARLATQREQLVNELHQTYQQLDALRLKGGDTDTLLVKTQTEKLSAEQGFAAAALAYESCRRAAATLATDVEHQHRECDERQRAIAPHEQEIVRWRSVLGTGAARLDGLEHDRRRSDERRLALTARRDTLLAVIQSASERLASLAAQVLTCQGEIEAIRSRKDTQNSQREQLLQELSEKQQRHSALNERACVLDDLLQRHEGLSPGVREVLKESKDSESPFRHAHGLVADIFHVDVESAILIDLALGAKVQQVVVSPEPELFRHIERRAHQFAGRVGFIWLDPRPANSESPSDTFAGRSGVLGRADQLVHTSPQFTSLARRLLGKTWIVESLAVAKKLYRESDEQTSFLTVSGEMLEADGTLVVGPQQTVTGLISRRSELRSVQEQQATLAETITEMQRVLLAARDQLAGDEKAMHVAAQRLDEVSKERDAHDRELRTAEERLAQVAQQEGELAQEIAEREAESATLMGQQKVAEESLATHETELRAANEALRLAMEHRDALKVEWHRHDEATTAAKVELAKSEERLKSLQERLTQVEERRQERRTQWDENAQRQRQWETRCSALDLAVLQHHATLSSLFAERESLTRDHRERMTVRAWLADHRKRWQTDLKKRQHELQNNAAQTHKHQLEVERLQQEAKTLTQRFDEDYKIDLAALDRAGSASSARDTSGDATSSGTASATAIGKEVQREIDDLRQKIERLGYVNLESMETLDALTTRHETLSRQHNDLVAAKRATERLMERVQVESQRMFEETFDGVRLHFREIFQQLFGGGNADLVMENPDAPLESGVEIVARPPGKELRSVTLMSGGEKTLTCVALLLAFFKYRPNPVCILDEVDAALDEGNIDRFVGVLRDFRLATQFLIITHSKKTMACAATLYGITMQESGVSKPIAVRFVDVGEHGEILAPPEEEPAPTIFSIDTPPHTAAAA